VASVARRRSAFRHAGSGETVAGATGERKWLFVGLAALLALAGFIGFVVLQGSSPRTAASGHFPDPPPPSLPTGSRPPAFDLPSIVTGGPPVSLATRRGEPLILSFFASWCRNCESDLSSFAQVARQESGRVAVVGIDTNDQAVATAARLLRKAGATYSVGVDGEAVVASRYLVTALPTTYFVGADGRIAGVAFGAQDVASLMHWVAELTVKGAS
jgi:cytochrome c biogenesis protein CcmG, thiol:disulfide interchange protein DsbE